MEKMKSIVKTENLNMSYGKTVALKDINLEIPTNSFIGLLGPNGSGKTTLLKVLAGLITSYSGQVYIDDGPVSAYTKSITSYLSSNPYATPRYQLDQLIDIYASFFPHFSTDKAESLFDFLNIPTNKGFGQLSKGLQAQVLLSLTLANNSKLFLLDEPFGGIDIATRDKIKKMIMESYPNGSTFIIATHEIHDMENLMDYVVILKDGEVLLNEPSDNIRSHNMQSIASYYKEVFQC